MKRRWLYGLLVFTTYVLAACTREPNNTAKLRLSMPTQSQKIGGQALNATLGHVAINISGPGIPSTILFSWDSHDCPTNNCPPPADFAVEAPAGSNRLIQVLGVYRDPNNAMIFTYGDVSKNLASGPETAEINLVILNSTSSGTGRVSGRYFDPTGVAPTGTISIKYQPPGKPTMIVDRSEMFAGWFNVFGLQDLSLTYELDTGLVLFGGPVNMQSAALTQAGVFRLAVPQHYRINGGGTNETEPATNMAFGFFGNPPTGTGCKLGSYSFTNRVVTIPSPALNYPSSFTPAGAMSACTGTEYVNYITFIPEMYDNNGNDSIAGFRGPFKRISSSQMISSSNGTIDWDYMPGISSALIDGVRIYAKAGSSNDLNGELDCQSLPSKGFLYMGDALMPNSEFSSAALTAIGNAAVVACPFKGPKFFNAALKTFVSGGGGGGAPTQIAVIKTQQPHGVKDYNCYEFAVELRDTNGAPTDYASAINFTLNPGTNVEAYATKDLCVNYGVQLGTGLTLPPRTNQFKFWARSTGSVASLDLNLTYTAGSPNLTALGANIQIINADIKTFTFEGPLTVLPNICYSTSVAYSTYDPYDYPITTTTTVSLSGTGGVQFFSNSGCTTSMTDVVITSPNSRSPDFFYKVNSGAIVPTAVLAATAGETGANAATYYFKLGSGSSTPTSMMLSLNAGSSPYRDSCFFYPITATFLNSQGVIVPLSSPGNFAVSSDNVPMAYYSDNMCNTNLTSSVATGSYKTQFYISPSSAGPTTLTATLNSTITQTFPIAVDGLHHINLVPQLSSPVNHGTCLPISIEPKTYEDNPSSFPSTTTVTLSATPSMSFFSSTVGGECVGALGSSINVPSTSSHLFYVAANNTSQASQGVSVSATASGVLGGSTNFTISAPPVLTSLDPSTQYIPAEYTFNLAKAVKMFTGILPYTFTQQTGTGSLSGTTYTSSGGDTATLRVTDSYSATPNFIDILTSTVVKTATLDFTSSLPSGVTLTRATTAYAYNSSGFLVQSSPNVARFGFNPDPISGHPALGLLIEGTSTNLVLYSEDFTSGWTTSGTLGTVTAATGVASPKNATGGGNGVYELNDNNENISNSGRAYYNFGDMTNGLEYVASVFIKSNTSQFAVIEIEEAAVTDTGVVIDFSNGNVTKLFGNTTSYGAQKLPNGWFRMWIRYTADNSSGSPGSMIIYPACNEPGGDLNRTGSAYVFGAQIEQSKIMTSYIPTSGATSSRDFDNVSTTINSTNIPGWISTAGSMRIEVFNLPGSQNPDYGTFLEMCYGGCSSNRLLMMRNSGARPYYNIKTGGVDQYPLLTLNTPLLENTTNTIGFSWSSGSANATNLGVNGKLLSSETASISVANFTNGTLTFGNMSAGNDSSNIYLKKIEYWPYKLSAPALGSF